MKWLGESCCCLHLQCRRDLTFCPKAGDIGSLWNLAMSYTARHDIAQAHDLITTCHENLRSQMCICSLQISLKLLFLAQLRTWSGNFTSCAMLDYKMQMLTVWYFLFCRAYKLIKFNWSIKVCWKLHFCAWIYHRVVNFAKSAYADIVHIACTVYLNSTSTRPYWLQCLLWKEHKCNK